MNKGIIVVDDIPVICAECDFAHLTQNKQYFHCAAKNKTLDMTIMSMVIVATALVLSGDLDEIEGSAEK